MLRMSTLMLAMLVIITPRILADDACPFAAPAGTQPVPMETLPLQALGSNGLDKIQRFLPNGFQAFRQLRGYRKQNGSTVFFLVYDNLCCSQAAYQWEQRVAVIERDTHGRIAIFPLVGRDGSPSRNTGYVNSVFKRNSRTYFVAVVLLHGGDCGAAVITKVKDRYVLVPFVYDVGITESAYASFAQVFKDEMPR